MGRNRSLVCGFGINDSNYVTNKFVSGSISVCPAYRSWKNMIERCYSNKYQSKRPTYIGTSVCDEWRSFMAFREWWMGNHVDGWHLDKDLLTDNRQYSPDNCIYVPSWINTFTSNSLASRGDLPVGVYFNKRDSAIIAQCNNPITGRTEKIGTFKSPVDAHMAWVNRKLTWAMMLKEKFDAVDVRIYSRVVEIIKTTT